MMDPGNLKCIPWQLLCTHVNSHRIGMATGGMSVAGKHALAIPFFFVPLLGLNDIACVITCLIICAPYEPPLTSIS